MVKDKVIAQNISLLSAVRREGCCMRNLWLRVVYEESFGL